MIFTILFLLSFAYGLYMFLHIVSDLIADKTFTFWQAYAWVICSTYNVWYLLIHSNF